MSVIAFATLSTARNGDISSSFWLTEQLDAGREGFVRGRGRVRGCRGAGPDDQCTELVQSSCLYI